MDVLKNILFAFLWFAVLGGALGAALAFAAKLFAVKVDERIPKIQEKLPGANCGGCGYAGCAALAEAIVKGEAKPSACVVGGDARSRPRSRRLWESRLKKPSVCARRSCARARRVREEEICL